MKFTKTINSIIIELNQNEKTVKYNREEFMLWVYGNHKIIKAVMKYQNLWERLEWTFEDVRAELSVFLMEKYDEYLLSDVCDNTWITNNANWGISKVLFKMNGLTHHSKNKLEKFDVKPMANYEEWEISNGERSEG